LTLLAGADHGHAQVSTWRVTNMRLVAAAATELGRTTTSTCMVHHVLADELHLVLPGLGSERGSCQRNKDDGLCSLSDNNLRGYSQTTYYSENQVFCFELFTVAHFFGFHPNTWISKLLVFFTTV
jgi:hypothetical protein